MSKSMSKIIIYLNSTKNIAADKIMKWVNHGIDPKTSSFLCAATGKLKSFPCLKSFRKVKRMANI